MKQKFFIGVDIGGTKIAAAIVTPKGKIVSRIKAATPLKAKPAVIFKLTTKLIEQILEESRLSANNLAGIGVGIPGIVDKHNHILATPNISLAGFPLCAKLKKEFRVPIAAGNDVNVGLLGEQWLGAAHKTKNVVGIFPGTGVGGAIIVNEKLLIGTQGAAAELGHMIVSPDGPPCHCGNSGCLEAFAGRWAIERDIRAGIKNGEKSYISKLMGGKTGPIKSKFLKNALNAHDPLVTTVMTKAGKILGQACISVRHILNPELIVLGGGVIEACGDFLLPIVNKTFHSDPFFAKVDHCKIVVSKLGDDAVILGAVALVR